MEHFLGVGSAYIFVDWTMADLPVVLGEERTSPSRSQSVGRVGREGTRRAAKPKRLPLSMLTNTMMRL
jgi:hypothetical protein